MGRHQYCQTVSCESVNLIPEFAPRLWIDAGGRLVEQQQLRAWQRASAKCQALLPPAGEFGRKLSFPPREAKSFNRGARRSDRMIDSIDPSDEFQVLAYREVLVEAETLRHIADLAFDLVSFGANVVTEAGSRSLIRSEQTAQHTNGGRLARPVWAQEAVDCPALHLHGQISDHSTTIELFGKAVDIDDDVVRVHLCGSCASVTVTGWPTRNLSGFSGRASIRNTNLARSS